MLGFGLSSGSFQHDVSARARGVPHSLHFRGRVSQAVDPGRKPGSFDRSGWHLKLVSWNVNGIRSVWRKGFLHWLEEARPDILCIQETKAHKEQLTNEILKDHGYHTYWHSGVIKGYSGVASFCKDEPLFVQEGLGIEKYDNEGRVLLTEHENFLLYNIY